MHKHKEYAPVIDIIIAQKTSNKHEKNMFVIEAIFTQAANGAGIINLFGR